MNIVTEIASMRSDLERLQQRTADRLAGGITEDDPVIARMVGRKVELERAIGVIEHLQAQLNAAKRGMDSAKDAGAKMIAIGKKLAAENSPEAIESEREANAVLTAENERLQDEVERLRNRTDALAEETGQWQSYFVHAVAGLSRSCEAGKKYREEAEEQYSNLVCTRQERDQLKAILAEYKSALNTLTIGCMLPASVSLELQRLWHLTPEHSLAAHDAEVIERIASEVDRLGEGVQVVSVNSRWLREYANQLRQQAKEVQS